MNAGSVGGKWERRGEEFSRAGGKMRREKCEARWKGGKTEGFLSGVGSVAWASGRPVAGLDRAMPSQKSLEICHEMGFVELADFLNWPASSWEKWSSMVL